MTDDERLRLDALDAVFEELLWACYHFSTVPLDAPRKRRKAATARAKAALYKFLRRMLPMWDHETMDEPYSLYVYYEDGELTLSMNLGMHWATPAERAAADARLRLLEDKLRVRLKEFMDSINNSMTLKWSHDIYTAETTFSREE